MKVPVEIGDFGSGMRTGRVATRIVALQYTIAAWIRMRLNMTT
jgi:hypothetical protein